MIAQNSVESQPAVDARPKSPTATEAVREAFALEACLIVDEQRRIVSAAPDVPTEFMQMLAEVAPTMALLPECRSLHTEYLRRARQELTDDQISSKMFQAAGKRFFVCAVGTCAHEKEGEILHAVVHGV